MKMRKIKSSGLHFTKKSDYLTWIDPKIVDWSQESTITRFNCKPQFNTIPIVMQ